jgi:hypothetical protein
MKESSCTITNSYFIHDSPAIEDLTDCVNVLDAKYEKSDLYMLVREMQYLLEGKQYLMLALLPSTQI